ncbi:MAG: hypothetical protein A07HN63_01822 [uncultured archaeon A07HN63]|nr:MAG: hypothetical protein A07HN63_01822 [uncultured archaeon A07HN63]
MPTTPVELGQLIGAAGLDGPEVDIALANFARKGYGEIDSGSVTADLDADPDSDPEVDALATLADGGSGADATPSTPIYSTSLTAAISLSSASTPSARSRSPTTPSTR